MICKYTECNKHRVKIKYENERLKERLRLTEIILDKKREQLANVRRELRLANDKEEK